MPDIKKVASVGQSPTYIDNVILNLFQDLDVNSYDRMLNQVQHDDLTRKAVR